jgi:uncharacterized protein with PIN domain
MKAPSTGVSYILNGRRAVKFVALLRASRIVYRIGVPSVQVRFYEELNDFLPEERRKNAFAAPFALGCTIKALVEDLGAPHTEIDLVLVNGDSVGFEFRLSDGDRVSVFPIFESWDLTGLSRVRPTPLRESRFVLDVHLGKLARLLRRFGFDASYANAATDEQIVLSARRERRIILTRDRGLLKRRAVTHGYLIRSSLPHEQLAEVFQRFDCRGQVRMFTRCIECNLPLTRIDAAEAVGRVPPIVAATYSEFSVCERCGRTFWRGSHWERMKKLAAEVLGTDPGSQDTR